MRGNMSESAQLGKSITPPEDAAVLAGDPLPGITAQGFADKLGNDPSNHDLAETITLAWAKAGHLMHLVEEDEASDNDLDQWLGLEKRLCREALVRDGVTPGEGPGLMGKIAPFMERNGYRDACGWWTPSDEYPESVDDGLCPKCGEPLEGFIEGSTVGGA